MAVGALTRLWIADDGLINVRIVDNVLAGQGPTFTSGIRAETGTSAVWLAVMSIGSAVPGLGADTVAVAGGLLLTLAGIALGCASIHRARPEAGVVVPLGLLGYASYSYAWDFASGGLENGAVTCWLGGLAWELGREARSHRAVVGLGLLIGLGPLLRPDLAVVSVVLLLAVTPRRRRWPWVDPRLVAAAALLPVASVVLRAAYFASLVPAAGLAKEGTSLRFAQGLSYGVTSLAPGGLAIVAGIAVALEVARSHPDRLARVVPARSAALALAGALHLAYVVAVGGDFMRGRLLLPGLFALALSVGGFVVPTGRVARRVVVVVAALVALLAVAGPTFRDPWVVDERDYYAEMAGDAHPISAADHDGSPWARGTEDLVTANPGSLIYMPGRGGTIRFVMPLSAEAAAEHSSVLVTSTLGIKGTLVDDDVAVLDPIGLADPVAAHARLVERGRPGHEKDLPPEWYVARFGDPDAPVPDGVDPAGVAAARRALGCGDLATLVEATTADLGPDRLVRNLLDAPRLTRFRFHPDPTTAAAELCPG
ncbi:MAG TPA: hypothetical protein VFU19_11600 [Iamia sp.]|nr:hypothetical protein [Iamia sp.]